MKDELSQIITHFTAAMKGMSLYPPGHQAIVKPIEKCIDLLKPFLFQKEQLLLGIVNKVLVFDGVPFQRTNPSIDELIDRLEGRKVEGVILRKGTKSGEIGKLLELLFYDPDELQRKGGAEAFLKRMNVKHIEIRKLMDTDVFEKARKVYSDARAEVISIMKESRMGKVPKADRAIRLVQEMSEIFLKERSALLGLTMIKDYDEYTFNHCVNVGILSLALGSTLKLKPNAQVAVGLAGFLHDIGKTVTPRDIISKPGILTEEEWEIMKLHPVEGWRIIRLMEGVSEFTATSVYQHHCKFNLQGYPALKDGEKANPGAHIVAIADCYDSMTTLRPYQKRFDPKETLEIMARRSGTDFDPAILNVFVRMLGLYPIGSLVRLDTNEIALVTRLNPEDPNLPAVKILYDPDGNRLPKPVEVSLTEKDPGSDQLKRMIASSVDSLTQGLIEVEGFFKSS